MPRLSGGEFGIKAHPAVRWLLASQPNVMAALKRFCIDQADSSSLSVEPGDVPPVRLNLKMVRGNLTGDLGVEVTCTDRDLAEIEKWKLASTTRTSGLLRGGGLN